MNQLKLLAVIISTVSNTSILLLHGDKDVNVLPHQASILMDALDTAGHNDHQLIMYEGTSHFWNGTNKVSRDANMYAFFDQKLKDDNTAVLSCSPYPSCQN